MPSVDNTPGVPELMKAFRGELAARDELADAHTGSGYDIWGGVAAVLLTRESQRIRDIFRANYFDQARGPELDEILTERFHDGRIVDGPGSGVAILSRSSLSAGAGTLWQGTRIEAAIPNGATRTYLIAANTTVAATVAAVHVPVVSVETGTDAAIDAAPSSPVLLRIADPLWTSWTVQRLQCDAGTVGESEEQAKARIRQQRADARIGYPKLIVRACKDAGATNVVLFGSDYLDTAPPGPAPTIGSLVSGYGDVGLNRIFVGDAGYVANHSLLVACRRAIASSAVLGTSVQVWGMTPVAFSCSITAQLWDDPGMFDQDSVREEIRNAVVDYFQTRSNAFYFRYVTLQGAIMRSVRSVQALTFSGGPSEPNLFTFLNTAALSRYVSAPGDLTVTLTGP